MLYSFNLFLTAYFGASYFLGASFAYAGLGLGGVVTLGELGVAAGAGVYGALAAGTGAGATAGV